MPEYIYPDNQTITQIAQDYIPRLTQDRPIFDIFPMEDEDADILRWDQLDAYKGLQQIRGLNGDPPKVARVGAKSYLMQPGTYGEFEVIDEREMTKRRQYGTFGTPIDLSDLVMQCQQHLLERRINRVEYIGWTLAVTGTFSIADVNGVVMHTDTYSNQTFSAGTAWSTASTSTPLADLRAVQLLGAGHSVDLGAGANVYMNRVQANRMLNNNNSADLAGRRTGGFGTFNSIAEMNTLFTADDLPNVVIYDEGYYNDAGTFTRYIPTGKAVVVGRRRNGQPIGAYKMTRNVNNPGFAPGPYMMVEDSLAVNKPPRRIAVHDGHNGGPVIYFPSAIVVMSV